MFLLNILLNNFWFNLVGIIWVIFFIWKLKLFFILVIFFFFIFNKEESLVLLLLNVIVGLNISILFILVLLNIVFCLLFFI